MVAAVPEDASPVACAAFCALVAGMMSLLSMWSGITLSPDGWAYWEGSVSLMKGLGFAYFGGQPITDFPPLFSLLLAAAQLVFGIRGATLICVVALLAALAAWAWTYPIFLHCRHTPAEQASAWCASVFIAAFIAANFTVLSADCLMLLLAGALMLALVADLRQPRRRTWLAATLCSVSLLLSKNSGLAFLAGAAAGAIAARPRGQAAVRVLLAGLLAVTTWAITRALLGQLNSHRGPAVHSLAENLSQGLADVAVRFGPQTGSIGALAFCTLLLLLGWRAIRPADPTVVQTDRVYLVTALTHFGALALLFSAAAVSDPMQGRFLWPSITCLVVAAGIAVRAPQQASAQRALGIALLGFLACMQLTRTVALVAERVTGRAVANVQWDDRIALPGTSGSGTQGRAVLVPPDFPWIDRHRSPR